LCTAIAVALCQRGYRTRFTIAMQLVDELLAAQQEHRLGRYLKQWSKYHLIIVDEVGFVPFSRSGAELLFNFFAEHTNVVRRGARSARAGRWCGTWNRSARPGKVLIDARLVLRHNIAYKL